MWNNLLVAMAGVLGLALFGFVFAWKALEAGRKVPRPGRQDLEESLDRIQEELRHARELARSAR
jgi:hypothetical protein